MPDSWNAFWTTEAAAGVQMVSFVSIVSCLFYCCKMAVLRKKPLLFDFDWLTPQLTFTNGATKLLHSCWKYLDVILYCRHFSQFICKNKINTAPNKKIGIARTYFLYSVQVDFYLRRNSSTFWIFMHIFAFLPRQYHYHSCNYLLHVQPAAG